MKNIAVNDVIKQSVLFSWVGDIFFLVVVFFEAIFIAIAMRNAIKLPTNCTITQIKIVMKWPWKLQLSVQTRI